MTDANGEQRDHLDRAYARLVGIRNNVPKPPNWVVSTSLVKQYHDALHHLEAAGYDVAEFQIPNDHLDQEEGMAERSLFLAQVEGVLGYFELRRAREEADATGEPPWLTVAGFKGPKSDSGDL